MTVDKKYIIDFLSRNKGILRQNYGVINIGLIGSYARNEQNDNSDIDFFVEFTKPSFHYLAGLLLFLENAFKKKVDITRNRKSLSKSFFNKVQEEIIIV